MRTFKADDLYFTPSEWFVAQITLVGTKEGFDCANYPCSWAQYTFCNNLKTIDTTQDPVTVGDHLTGLNTAYPLDPDAVPNVGDIVIMRFRGTDTNGRNVYEFVSPSAGGGGDPQSCCRVLNASCASGYLAVTYSDSCFYTTTSTTSTSTSSTTSTSTTTAYPLSFLSTSPISEARVGDGYGFGFVMTGGSGEYVNFAITAGALPNGLSLDPATGVISGIPAPGTAGTYSFTVEVTDSLGATVSQPFTLVVQPAAAGDFISVNGLGDAMTINSSGDRLLWG